MNASTGKAIIIALCMLMCLGTLTIALAADSSFTLSGKVEGRHGEEKPFVRVQISPGSHTLFTDDAGQFSVPLGDGVYKVEVSEGHRAMRFTVKMPGKDKSVTLKLKW